jgi:hypothetical protein
MSAAQAITTISNGSDSNSSKLHSRRGSRNSNRHRQQQNTTRLRLAFHLHGLVSIPHNHRFVHSANNPPAP